MTGKNTKWDDIPSLDGLQMDWEYEAEKPQGQRKFERMSDEYVTSLFKTENIRVRVVTEKLTLDGLLSDVSAGGLSLVLKKELAVNDFAKIGFYLNKQKIISRAVVKQSTPLHSGFKIRFQFQNIKEEYSQYINGLYSAKILNR